MSWLARLRAALDSLDEAEAALERSEHTLASYGDRDSTGRSLRAAVQAIDGMRSELERRLRAIEEAA